MSVIDAPGVRSFLRALLTVVILFPAPAYAGNVVDYDIVYVRQPRHGDVTPIVWPDVAQPGRLEPGAELMLLHPDGSQEVLVDPGPGAVTDPAVSLDGQWVYYSLFHDVEALNNERLGLSYAGSDIYRIHIHSRTVEQLTFGEFTPATAAGNWTSDPLEADTTQFNSLGYGVMNTGPCPLPNGKLAFTSTRNGLEVPRGGRYGVFQLFVMDEDGANVTPIAPMSLSGALHPTLLRDGRILFSSHESQGARDRRQWSLMAIKPDGRDWTPVVSAFRRAQAFHFPTQLADGNVVFVDYYNLHNLGFGALRRLPEPGFDTMGPFHSAIKDENPRLYFTDSDGISTNFRMPFTPVGMFSLTPFTHAKDQAAPLLPDGETRAGKLTQPTAAPENDILVVWSGGPVNTLQRPVNLPTVDSGIYLIPGAATMNSHEDLIEILNDPDYNEAWPRPVVAWSDIHPAPPAELPWLPNDGSEHELLPKGTPFGLIGSSSVIRRETAPGFTEDTPEWNGLDPFSSASGASSNWSWQGAEAGLYEDEDVYAIRLLMLEPTTHRSYGPNAGRHFDNHAGERMRILGEVPVLKPAPGGGYEELTPGTPDSSFLARIPADTPFTFQTIDRRGMVLNMSQTWHQVRPGELRNNCGGCHAHSQVPIEFDATIASTPDYNVPDLTNGTPLLNPTGGDDPEILWTNNAAEDVEFYRDIRPILQRSCIPCHTRNSPLPAGQLVLDDYALYNDLPGDYARLAADPAGQWGYPAVANGGAWIGMNASRYVRMFQSRRSLLMWKLHGERLDGWSNEDHPTETTPGDASTLPPGTNAQDADLDFTGTQMPPPGSGVAPLTDAERMTFARWIDLGCPIDTGLHTGHEDFGWFLDELRPVVHVDAPRPGQADAPISELRIGLTDPGSGLDMSSLSVTTTASIMGRAPGAELADLFVHEGDSIWTAELTDPITSTATINLTVSIDDVQGNRNTIVRRFSVAPTGCIADFDNDNIITISDLNVVLENWQDTVDPGTSGDASGDGLVDFTDLNRILTQWGETCP